MSQVAVVTDSTHYLPKELVESHDLHQVSLYVSWEGRTVRETELDDFDHFYEYLANCETLPTTSQPSVGDFLETYKPLLEQGCDVLSIHVSGDTSGTVRAAEQARDKLVEEGADPKRFEIIDSKTVCGSLGTMALAGAATARATGDLQEAAKSARLARKEVNARFVVETLEYLRRGGRIGNATAWIGSALKIKPILAFESQVHPIERVRTSGRAFKWMVDYLEECHTNGSPEWFVQHIRAPEKAEELAVRGREIYGCDPRFVSEIGPVIGTHGGPGLFGAAGFGRN